MISIIAAVGKNGELGYKNDLLMKIPEDLRFFREKTNGKIMVMGRNTFDSLPKVLSNRIHLVLTSRDIIADDNVISFNNLDSLFEYINNIEDEVMVIGGAKIYNIFVDYADKMYLTLIDKEFSYADSYFPNIDYNKWDTCDMGSYNYKDTSYKRVKYLRKGKK